MNVRQLILRLRKLDTFHINTELFPKDTKALIPLALIKKFGVLPLGIKGENFLNIGLVDPYRLDARDAMTLLAKESGKSVHFYAISQNDFDAVLATVYKA